MTLVIDQHLRSLISVGVLPVEFFMNLEKSRRRRNPRVIAMCSILKSRLPVRNVRDASSNFDFLNSSKSYSPGFLYGFFDVTPMHAKDAGEIAKRTAWIG